MGRLGPQLVWKGLLPAEWRDCLKETLLITEDNARSLMKELIKVSSSGWLQVWNARNGVLHGTTSGRTAERARIMTEVQSALAPVDMGGVGVDDWYDRVMANKVVAIMEVLHTPGTFTHELLKAALERLQRVHCCSAPALSVRRPTTRAPVSYLDRI